MSDAANSEYGLGIRNRDGELRTVEHTFRFGGEEVTIGFRPPTSPEVEEIEHTLDQDDVEAGALEETVREFLHKPNVPDDVDLTLRECTAYLTGIFEWSSGGAGVHEEVLEELDELQDDVQGN